MDARSWMMLRVFINRYNPKAGNALLRFLPSDEMQSVLKQDIRSTNLDPLLQQPQRLIEHLHYSWIQPLIDQFPKQLQPLILAVLHAKQAQPDQSPPLSITGPARTFILNQLYTFLQADQHLPLDYLPETELFPLAKWEKKDLVTLISFLGLYDLATEVRHIVNRRHLENIYACLSPKQQYYLKVCLYQKERLVSPRLGINPEERNCEKLHKIMHQRGIVRLARALAGEHPDLIWYIAHALDRGRGKLLMSYYQPQPIANVTQILRSQVTNLMNFLKKE